MTPQAAIYNFLSSFDLPAYDMYSVPSGEDAPTMPYLTYNMSIDYFGTETPLEVNLWYRTTNNTIPNAKVALIGQRIGLGGIVLPCDNGALWVKRGSPFAQSLSDANDESIKRRYINLTVEVLTTN